MWLSFRSAPTLDSLDRPSLLPIAGCQTAGVVWPEVIGVRLSACAARACAQFAAPPGPSAHAHRCRLHSGVMTGLRRHHRFAQWLTLLAMVLATLAPGVARALAFAQGDASPWDMVCSTGAKATADAPAGGASAADAQDSCCLLRCDLLAPPSSVELAVPGPLFGTSVPLLFLRAPGPLWAWIAAQPRGPPKAV